MTWGGRVRGAWVCALVALALSGCSSGPTHVVVPLLGTPQFAYYRQGQGQWSAPEDLGSGNYQLTLSDGPDYEFATGCISSLGEGLVSGEVSEVMATASDRVSPIFVCGGVFATSYSTVTVAVDEPGMAHLGPFVIGGGSAANWTATATVPSGQYDLVVGGSNSIAIQRGVSCEGSNVDLGAVSLASSGIPLVAVPVSVVGASGAGLESFFETSDTFSRFGFTGGDVDGVATNPTTLSSGLGDTVLTFQAGSGDMLGVFADVETSSFLRETISYSLVSTIELPPPLDATFDSGLSAHWSTATDGADVYLVREPPTFGTSPILIQLDVVATSEWLGTSGAGSAIAFDQTFPGFDPSWICNEDGCLDSLSFDGNTDGGETITSITVPSNSD